MAIEHIEPMKTMAFRHFTGRKHIVFWIQILMMSIINSTQINRIFIIKNNGSSKNQSIQMPQKLLEGLDRILDCTFLYFTLYCNIRISMGNYWRTRPEEKSQIQNFKQVSTSIRYHYDCDKNEQAKFEEPSLPLQTQSKSEQAIDQERQQAQNSPLQDKSAKQKQNDTKGIEKKEETPESELHGTNIATFQVQKTDLEQKSPSQQPREAISYEQLILREVPGSLVSQVRKLQRKRTLILWLKGDPKSQSQKQRDQVLRKQGYQVYSSNIFDQITLKYSQLQNQLFIWTFLLCSFCDNSDNELAIKQLMEHFIQSKKVKSLIIVKPAKESQYCQWFQNLKASSMILEVEFPVQQIKTKLAQLQLRPQANSMHLHKLVYWPHKIFLTEIRENNDKVSIFTTEARIVLSACLRIGQSLSQCQQTTELSKQLLNQYLTFDFLYTEKNKKEHLARQKQLKQTGLSLLQDPLGFYLKKENKYLIDRLMTFHSDRLNSLANVMFPLTLIFEAIKENHIKQTLSKQYKHGFVCFAEARISQQFLEDIEVGQVFQNLCFLQAKLTKVHTKVDEIQFSNVVFLINVSAKQRLSSLQSGFIFLEQLQEPSISFIFKGYKSVLFNLLNTFKVLLRTYDPATKMYYIQLEYGSVARQYYLREQENYIPKEEEQKYHRGGGSKKQKIDYGVIVKNQSVFEIEKQITDFGDVYAVLGCHRQAISYYESLFKKNRVFMGNDNRLLALLSTKKADRYLQINNSKSAIEYYYNALNTYIKTNQTKEEQNKLYFSEEYQKIYIKTFVALQKSRQWIKMVSFGQSLLKTSKLRGGVHQHSLFFLVQVYQKMVQGYLEMVSRQWRVKEEQSKTDQYIDLGLKVIEQLGQYNPVVPEFYFTLAKCQMQKRSMLEAVSYLNKAVLITKMVKTIHDPVLCPFYLYLSIGYFVMHDYRQALRTVSLCLENYQRYYKENNWRIIAALHVQGLVFKQMKAFNDAKIVINQAIQCVQQYQKRSKKGKEHNLWSRNEAIGMLNRLKQSNQEYTSFNKVLNCDLNQIRLSIYYIQLASIAQRKFDFKDSSINIQKALQVNIKDHGQFDFLNIDILLLMAKNELKMNKNDRVLDLAKQIWKLIVQTKRENKRQAVQYNLLLAEIYSSTNKLELCYQALSKARQIGFNVYKAHKKIHLCHLIDRLAFCCLKINKRIQAGRLFNQSAAITEALLKEIQHKRQTITLYGMDFQQYAQEVRDSQILTELNQAKLYLAQKNIDKSKELLCKCLQTSKTEVGEYKILTAQIYLTLGILLFQNSSETIQALEHLNNALYMYSASESYEMIIKTAQIEMILVKVSLRQHCVDKALKRMTKGFQVLRKIHKVGYLLQEMQEAFWKIVTIIRDTNNLDSFKNMYFTVADLSENLKKSNKETTIKEFETLADKLTELLDNLRDKISQLSETQNQVIEKQRKQQFSERV